MKKQRNSMVEAMKYRELLEKIKKKKAKVSVIGLGYVGLPLIVEFAKKGFSVTGLDTDSDKINNLRKGRSYIEDIGSNTIKRIVAEKNILFTSDYNKISYQDVVIICVPTPLRKTGEPDLSFVIKVSKKLALHIGDKALIILESTSYPGTTREVLLAEFEKKGFIGEKDVFVAFSPERIDPGNKKYTIKNTPKVVGAIGKKSLALSKQLYSAIVDKVVVVNSCEEAEMVKLLENTFRAVNIGLINELAMLCKKFDLDIWNIIKAAGTKPYGFMTFYPGPGLGGHCIPVDPQYLSWKAKKMEFYPSFIENADKVNSSMPEYVVERLKALFKQQRKKMSGSKILILGVSYKRGVGDLRESPAYDISKFLKRSKVRLSYCDPYVKKFSDIQRVPVKKIDFNKYDCILIITDHKDFDYKKITDTAKMVMDCRGVTSGLNCKTIVERI